MPKIEVNIKTTIPAASAYNGRAKVYTRKSPQEGHTDIWILWKGPVYWDPIKEDTVAVPRRFRLDTVPDAEAQAYISNLVVDINYVGVSKAILDEELEGGK